MENVCVHDTRHGTGNTKVASKEILKVFLCMHIVKNIVASDNV
jgi:hypothetical protein